MTGVFGSCEGPKWTFENGFYCITGIEHCVTGEPLKIPEAPDVVTGVKIGDDPTVYEPDADGCITLPATEDLFGSGIISDDGTTLTVQFPNMDGPVDICLDPVKGAVLLDGEGNVISQIPVIDGILQLPDQSICWGTNDDGCVVVGIKHCQTGEFLVLDYVTSVSGPGVTVDGKDVTVGQSSFSQDPDTGVITHTASDGTDVTADTKYSTTVPAPEGFHTITTDDGVATQVCLTPVKTVNGVTPDINGNVNAADLFSTTTDNGDGTYTTVNADGTPVTWSGDTFASGNENGDGTATITFSDSSKLTFCLNPVKSVMQNEDGLGATVTLADGTSGQLTYPSATILDCDKKPYDLNTARFNAIGQMASRGDGLYSDLTKLGYANPDAVAGDADFCLPNTPSCPELPRMVVDKEARVVRCWDGDKWSDPLPFAGTERLYFDFTQVALTFDDAALQALNGAGFVDIASEIFEWTNPYCYPVWCSSTFTSDMLYRGHEGFRAEVRRVDGDVLSPGDNYIYKSIGQVEFDTRRLNPGTSDSLNAVTREQRVKVSPGETVVLNEDTEIRVLNYTPNATNSFRINSRSLCVECEPCP